MRSDIRPYPLRGAFVQVNALLTIESIVESIPGEDGWWKSGSQTDFLKAAKRLYALGMPLKEIESFLTELYVAVENCLS